MTKLKNKTVMITGASSGFGAAFANAFAAEGANLILIARRKDRLLELEKKIKNNHSIDIISIVLDVSNQKTVHEKLATLPEKFRSPDVLINNAGMVKGLNKLWETKPEEWDQMIDTNVKGILNVSREIIPRMLEKNKGDIINISSISGHDTYPGGSIYCATKYAVRAITDTLRKELVSTPLRVSMISPGMANTEFSLVRFDGDQTKADSVYKGIEPLSSEDVAEIAVFIATRRPNVNIADIMVYPTHQASAFVVHREAS